MKFTKLFVATITLMVTGQAAFAVGPYREEGETPRHGQLICQQVSRSQHKGAAQSDRQVAQDRAQIGQSREAR